MGGRWERRARALGFVIEEVAGLTTAVAVDLPGLDTVLLIPDWARGRFRDLLLGGLLGEVWLGRYGESDDHWATRERAGRDRWAS